MGALSNKSYNITRSKAPVHQGSQLGLLRGIADLVCAYGPTTPSWGFWATEQQHLGQNGVNCNHNVVVAGRDLVAVEAVSQMVMGFNPLDSDLLRMMNRKRMGQWNPDSIKIAGPPANKLARNFIRAANTYSARGLRTWLAAGPLDNPIDKPGDLTPAAGAQVSGTTWNIFNGDSVIDAGVNSAPPYSYQQCLLYTLPGSEQAREGAVWYLAMTISTPRKDLCGQLLAGAEGASVRAFFNGKELALNRDPLTYNPTPMPFIKFREGANLLVLEFRKGKADRVKAAANVCDLDGDRLFDIVLDPRNE